MRITPKRVRFSLTPLALIAVALILASATACVRFDTAPTFTGVDNMTQEMCDHLRHQGLEVWRNILADVRADTSCSMTDEQLAGEARAINMLDTACFRVSTNGVYARADAECILEADTLARLKACEWKLPVSIGQKALDETLQYEGKLRAAYCRV